MVNENMAIQVRDLTVAYSNKPVLWDIDIEVPHGSLLAIVGPNGAGKTTLIKAIQNLIPSAAGSVLIHGKPYAKQRKIVSYVPQRGTVDWDFPTSVVDIVKMGSYGELGWIKRPGKTQHEKAMAALEKVEMADYSHRQISQLSGGQQQRVFLARALMQDASVYFLDEPFQGVDATTEKAIVKLLQELSSHGKTLMVVHHDLNTVAEYFDSVAILNVELICSGKISEVFNNQNLEKAYGGRVPFFRKNSPYGDSVRSVI